jgi:hypothetical protein
VNLVTPKAESQLELFFNKPASAATYFAPVGQWTFKWMMNFSKKKKLLFQNAEAAAAAEAQMKWNEKSVVFRFWTGS